MSVNKKLQLKDIDFNIVEEILDKLFQSKQIDGKNEKFEEIWKENFVDKFEENVCKKTNDKYENPIVQIIYENCKEFYKNGCNEILENIKKIQADIDKIWEKN